MINLAALIEIDFFFFFLPRNCHEYKTDFSIQVDTWKRGDWKNKKKNKQKSYTPELSSMLNLNIA